ncbi:MAG: helix-turn-helix domain-containing protein [Actinomycetes bacterium]
MRLEATVGLEARDHLSRLNALLVLAMLMTESTDEQQILRMGASAAPSFADCRLVGVRTRDGASTNWTPGSAGENEPPGLDLMPSNGGELMIPDALYAWAFGLGGGPGTHGCMVVAADRELRSDEQFLLRVLAQQIGSATRNSRLHQLERTAAAELESVNRHLEDTVEALKQRIEIHDRLTRAAVAGEGMDGIARAVHEVTGLPVTIEDRYGNLRAWAGPDQPGSHAKDTPARREQLVRRLLHAGHPLRESSQIMTAASPRPDSVAVISLIDPQERARDEDLAALEYGATILSMELARQRTVADTEIRIRRDLIEDLLSGESTETALARGETFGRDLSQPHRVIVCERQGRTRDDDHFFTSVRRSARDLNLGQLLVSRGGTVVLLTDREIEWTDLHAAVMRELGSGQCRIGVGSHTASVADFPRSHREALLALRLQRDAGPTQRVTAFDQLGVYRLLANTEDSQEIERFAREWLGALLDYDTQRHSELVQTLHEYLECGGRYDEAALALSIHRSTLKYRLQRIREVSGLALGEPDVNFNLQLACRAWRTLQSLRG